MKQISLATTGYELIQKRTRKRVFLEEMNLVVPWSELEGLSRLPDETTILRFRHLLEAHNLSLQIMATINALLTQRGLLLRTYGCRHIRQHA